MADLKIEIEGVVRIRAEDAGCALISDGFDHDPDSDDGFFVRLQSWDLTKQHPVMRQLAGKRVRVTVEIIDP